ncbi:MAG TPA: tetratricopeptide repeat protein [Candidatus Angelobacter sp.]|nr:tetratricopeptide repeat protein [Candidatus Angelobacter sp.]
MNWRTTGILIFFGILLARSAPTQGAEENSRHCNSLDPDIRISGCTAVIRSNQKSYNRALAFFNRGTAYFQKHQFDRAVSDFNDVIRLTPDFAPAFDFRARTYDALEKYDYAIEDYDHAIKLSPNSVNSIVGRGTTYHLKHEYDRAIQDYKEALRLQPENPSAHNNLADVYATADDQQYRDPVEALKHAEKAVELDPTARHLDTLAEALYTNHRFREAVDVETKAIALNPKDETLRSTLKNNMKRFTDALSEKPQPSPPH